MNATGSPRPRNRKGPPAGVRLAGTGMATPARVVTNDDLAKTVDTNDQWITQRTGIRQRRLVGPGVTCKALAADAVRQAIANAGLPPGDLDLLLLASLTPDMICPSTAAQVVAEIGAAPCGAIDVNAACSGFVYAVNMAFGLLQTGHYRNIAVVGAEVLSSITDWKDRSTCVLFGDGAGAAVFSASDNPAQTCLHQSLASDGRRWADLYVPRDASQVPPGAAFSGAFNTLQMNGREVYKFAVTTLQACIEESLQATGLAVGDLAAIIPHQSNARILESAREKLGLSAEQFIINIDRYGNTSAASVPICLHEMTAAGRLKPGDLVLLVALGGGLTWASSLWRI